MKKCRFAAIFLALALVLPVMAPSALAADPPEVTAGAALLMDAANDEVLYEKNANERMYPASITKVMTALLVLEAVDAGQLSLDQVITASNTYQSDLSPNGSSQNIRPGEQMSVRDLLYCLLVASANEAANILAEAVDGSVSAFVEHMNRRALELGCSETSFSNAHGLHDDNHYTTAHDIYLFARQAMTNDTFRDIVSTQYYRVPATNLSGERLFYSTNALLVTWYYHESYIYDRAIGIKTGTTDEGGHCLLSAAEDGERYLICVVLNAQQVAKEDGSTDHRQFSESRRLLQWGFSNFQRQAIVDTETPVDQVEVTLSEVDHVLVRPGQQLERTLPVDLDPEEIQQQIHLDSRSIQAPVQAGQVLGRLTLSYQGEVLGEVDLVAVEDVERSELLYRIHCVQDFFHNYGVALAVILAVLAVGLVILRLTVFGRRGRYGGRGRRTRGGNYRGRRR